MQKLEKQSIGPRGWIKDDPGGKFEEGKRRALTKPKPTETKKPFSSHAQSLAKNAH